ncbi:MAG: ABC transporter permease subunit, partial [Sulfolobales archaeon]
GGRVVGVGGVGRVLSGVMPNIMPSILSLWTLVIGEAILTEASLGFLGFSDSNFPSLGTMLMMARSAIFVGGWWVLLYPSIMIVILILVFNMLSDKLIESLSPKLG